MNYRVLNIIKTKKYRNTFFGFLDGVLYPALLFLLVPVFMTSLGSEDFGIWIFVNSMVTVLAVLNIGIPDSLIRYIGLYSSDQERSKQLAIILTLGMLQLIITFLIIVLGTVAYLFFRFDNDLIARCLYLGSVIFSIRIFEQYLCAIFKSYERFDISTLMASFSKICILSTQVFVAFRSGRIEDMIFYGMLCYIAIVFCYVVFIFCFFRKEIHFSYISVNEIKLVKSYLGWGWFSSTLAVSASQIDRVLIAYLGGFTSLAYYSIGLMIFNNAHMVFGSSLSWLAPAFARVKSRQDLYVIFNQYFFNVFLVSYVLFFILRQLSFLLQYWLDFESYSASKSFIDYFFMILPLYASTIVPYYFLKGTGNIKSNALSDLLTLTVRFIVTILFFSFMGVYSAILAIGLSGVFLFSSLFYGVYKEFGRSQSMAKLYFYMIVLMVFSFMGFNFLNSVWSTVVAILVVSFAFIIKEHDSKLQ